MPEAAAPRTLTPRILEPVSSCAPCIESLDDLDWPAATTFLAGEWALGVRSSTVELDASLRRILAAHVGDVDAPANFSALLAADTPPRGFNFLYRADEILVRTRTPRRVVRTLLHHLSEFAAPAPDTTAPKLAAVGFVAGGRAVVAPERIRTELPNIESRLNARGIAVVDAPVLHVDTRTASIVVPEPALTVDAAALADFERRQPSTARELEPVAAGRYPIAAWAFTTDSERIGPLPVAPAVAAAAQQVVNADGFGAQAVLDDMVALLSAAPAFGMWWDDAAELTRQLLDLSEIA